MKKILSMFLIGILLLSSCIKNNEGLEIIRNTKSSDLYDSNTITSGNLINETSFQTKLVEAQEVEGKLEFNELDDPRLLQYVEDNVYAHLESELNTNEYIIENVSAVYKSKEYIEELEYNSQANIYFGYTLDEINALFEDSKYVFTLSENGKTSVRELLVQKDNTFNDVVKNIAVGSGVILVSVIVSTASGGLGSPAIAAVFAASAKSGTLLAFSSSLISGVVAGVVTGYQTKDFEEAVLAGNLKGSEGFKWGAVSGVLLGGSKEALTIAGKRIGLPPTPRESERYALTKIGGREQVTYSKGIEVPYGTLGASRPDLVKKTGKTLHAYEIKNYDLKNNKSKLISTLREQIENRAINMPPGTHQHVVLDGRRRGYSKIFLKDIAKEIKRELSQIVPDISVNFFGGN